MTRDVVVENLERNPHRRSNMETGEQFVKCLKGKTDRSYPARKTDATL